MKNKAWLIIFLLLFVGAGSSVALKYTIDGLSGAIVTVTQDHHEIHEGDHYFIKNFVSLGLGDSLKFCVTVPDTIARVHMAFGFSSDLTMTFKVFEAATCSGGTPVTAYNNDRNSDNASMLTIDVGAAVTNFGTQIEGHTFGSGTNPGNARPGESSREAELILKNNTKYLFLFISGAAANRLDYDADWYEHISKE